MALLAFAGFLIFDVLSSLKLKDLVSRQYQYQYHEGALIPIVKTGTDLCPLVNLLKYLSQAKLSLPTSANGSHSSLFFFFCPQTLFTH